MVETSGSQLVVAPVEATVGGLCEAVKVASRAIEVLPETPMSASGVNFRYRFDAIPDELLKAVGSSLDDRLAEADLRIVGRLLKRSVTWKQGVLNVEVHEAEDASGLLLLNFHRPSMDGKALVEWLGQWEAMVAEVKRLSGSTFKVKIEEGNDE